MICLLLTKKTIIKGIQLEYDFHDLSLEIEKKFVLTFSSMEMFEKNQLRNFEKLNIPFW
jgi:hypothetical protein